MTEDPRTALAVIEKSQEIRLAAQLPAKHWPDERIKAIAKTVAPEGTGVPELALFLSVAHRYDLDPFVNEIWLVKDEKKNRLMVMTGRDAYLKIAMRDPGYLGINSGVVYEKDTFKQIKSGDGSKVEIQHEVHSMTSRGRIVGAYCVAYHKTRLPVVIVRTWDHYKKLHGRSTWQSNPDDMLETRVIVAALRRQYNISGIYTEAEWAGVDEGDGALQDFKANENVLSATQERVRELRAQIEQMEGKQEHIPEEGDIPTAVVVEESVGREHGPVEVGVDAYLVEAEEEPPEEPKQDKKVRKLHIRYMSLWNEVVGAGDEFRHRWQKAAIMKESTKDWTESDYADAIDLIETGGWTQFVTAKGQDSIQPEL